MQLQNFQLSKDGISLIWQGQDLDLHNCFNFESISYNVALRQVELIWRRSSEEWAKNVVMPGLMLVFKSVSFFRVKERDAEYPFAEDNCLCSVSFHPVESRGEFDSISLSNSSTDDLTFYLQSDWGFKINAPTVELLPLAYQ